MQPVTLHRNELLSSEMFISAALLEGKANILQLFVTVGL